jgi:uncharacterized C2H2 Zn-finger protein
VLLTMKGGVCQLIFYITEVYLPLRYLYCNSLLKPCQVPSPQTTTINPSDKKGVDNPPQTGYIIRELKLIKGGQIVVYCPQCDEWVRKKKVMKDGVGHFECPKCGTVN